DKEGDKKDRPVIGFQLSKKIESQQTRDISNAIDLFQSLFITMIEAHDARHISVIQAPKIFFIPVYNVATTEFDMSDETKEALLELGRVRTQKFLKKWTY